MKEKFEKGGARVSSWLHLTRYFKLNLIIKTG